MIAEQICEALGEAQSRGIIHRDLKPQNIMIARKEGQDWVKVVDVGIVLYEMIAVAFPTPGNKVSHRKVVPFRRCPDPQSP
jgi:serine/threonine protein kinase